MSVPEARFTRVGKTQKTLAGLSYFPNSSGPR